MYGLVTLVIPAAADIVPPTTALAFVTKMSQKNKSTLTSAIQVKKNWQKTISIEEKLEVISQIGKGK
jgi:hypothetical protein